ncbi:phosphatidate cytidylyltransferase [Micromonospora musae]|uniref:phosphatidate cytidylyltransferase n=1 Tax=Micromonospora musae TaxID=1894970 RepID=UPI0033FBB392
MSPLDPYSGAEPRGWDRPDRPAALPWPDPEIDPGPWTRNPAPGPELYGEPRTRSRPAADPYDDGGSYPAGPYDDRDGPYPPDPYDDRRHSGPARPGRGGPPHGERDRYRDRRADPYGDDERYQGGPPAPHRERYSDEPYPDRYGDDRGPDQYRERPDERGYPDERRHPDERGYPDERRHPGERGYPDERRHPDERGYADERRHVDEQGYADERTGRYDDESGFPTAQLEPIRADLAPDPVRADLAPVPEPERAPGRRGPGKRRASADRPATLQASGRAGRNLPAAIGVGLGLGALILLPLFLYPPLFLAVVVAAVCIGVWELTRAVGRSGANPPLVPLVAGGALTVGLAWFAGPDALSLGLLVTVLGVMIWRLGDGPAGYQRDLTASTLIAVYVPFLGGFAALLAAAPDDGPWRILAALIAVVLSDTGGYAAGVFLGKHPMAPTVSPKKSWEGFGGSVTAAALGSALLLWLVFDVAPWWGAVFGVAISCAAVLGDLAESMIKRDLGVKDMSNLLPGHGGLMDRLDSILFAVPTAYLLLAVLVPVAG